jgi:hypothetical protein
LEERRVTTVTELYPSPLSDPAGPQGRGGPDGADGLDGLSPSELAVWSQRELGWEELVAEARRLGPDPQLAELADGEVEAGVCDLAGQLAATTCRWLGFIAELTVRGIWADQGARTPAQWLSWKAGVAPSTAREHVRVALRLRELPRIRAAFAAGRLSYSKVRALTRLAIPQLEGLLLRWADAATAAELETIARNFRSTRRAVTADHDDGGDPRYRWRERSHADGTMTLTITAPAEELVELRDRLERRCQLARRHAAPADEVHASAGTDDPDLRASAEAGDGASAEADGDDEAVHRSSGEELITELLHTVVAADPDTVVDTSGLDRHTLVLYAHAADLTDPTADLTDPSADLTDPSAADDDPRPAGPPPASRPGATVAVQDPHGRIRAMDRQVLRRLACDAGIVLAATDAHGTPLDLGRRRRSLSAALRRAVHLRDRTCTFPGCHATRHLHAHHVHHWSDGGSTDLANLVLLCAAHHRYVHDHALTIEVRPDGRHRFRPPDGPPLPLHDQLTADHHDSHRPDPGPYPTDGLEPATWAGPRTADHDLILAVLDQEFRRLAPQLTTAA